MTAIGRLVWTAIDCPDARSLADFYSAVTGWPIDETSSDDGWVQLDAGGGTTLAFQQVDDFHRPQWPGQEHPQQAHPDFWVGDLDSAEAQVLAAGRDQARGAAVPIGVARLRRPGRAPVLPRHRVTVAEPSLPHFVNDSAVVRAEVDQGLAQTVVTADT